MKNAARSMKAGISDKTVERILASNGLKNSGVTVYSISKKKTGYGHWQIEIAFYKQLTISDSFFAKVTTTDSVLIDNWNKQGSMGIALQLVLNNETNLENFTLWATYPD